MALALVPRREAQRFNRPKRIRFDNVPAVREQIRTETRYAEFRQRLV
jgi:hypothetical protein